MYLSSIVYCHCVSTTVSGHPYLLLLYAQWCYFYHVSTTYGVVRDSILNDSKHFHVTDGLVPDVMHDVLEGCAPYVVKELLKYLSQHSIVTLDELNTQTVCTLGRPEQAYTNSLNNVIII